MFYPTLADRTGISRFEEVGSYLRTMTSGVRVAVMTGDQRAEDAELLEAAQQALKRIKAREGEDPYVWASRLAEDLSKFTD